MLALPPGRHRDAALELRVELFERNPDCDRRTITLALAQWVRLCMSVDEAGDICAAFDARIKEASRFAETIAVQQQALWKSLVAAACRRN